MDDREIAALLSQMPPKPRDVLRRLMRADQLERDEFAAALLKREGEWAALVADLIDAASLDPRVRQQIARVLGHLEAADA